MSNHPLTRQHAALDLVIAEIERLQRELSQALARLEVLLMELHQQHDHEEDRRR